MIHYIIQVMVFQLLFLAVYDLFLKKETFFQWNRIYLLATPLLALVLPLIKISAFQHVIPQQYTFALPEIIVGKASIPAVEQTAKDPVSILGILLIVGMAISFLLFIWKLIFLFRLRQNKKTCLFEGVRYIELPGSTQAFSFVNLIFIGENVAEESKESVLIHELVHIKQKHFLDLFYFELLRIIFWFNPTVYIFQNRVKELHEYIADHKAISQTARKIYYKTLLSQAFQTKTFSFINTFFNHSLIKKRISMLQKSNSKKIFRWKYALIIPTLIGMLLYTSCSQEESKANSVSDKISELKFAIENDVEISEKQREEYQKWINSLELVSSQLESQSKKTADGVPFALVDLVPAFPDCTGTNEEKKQCVSGKIATFVNENFNVDVADNTGLSGGQRISIQFAIDAEGNVTDAVARSSHPDLTQEAIRVINLLPKMIPGEQNGEKVKILYSLPILFEL